MLELFAVVALIGGLILLALVLAAAGALFKLFFKVLLLPLTLLFGALKLLLVAALTLLAIVLAPVLLALLLAIGVPVLLLLLFALPLLAIGGLLHLGGVVAAG